jgi:hypothetical protein
MRVLVPAAAAILFAGAAAAETADELYTRYFAGADDGKPCYAHNYDGAHLRAHPKQTVRRIRLSFDKDEGEGQGPKNTAAKFEASIEFTLKRSPEWYGDALYCKVVGSRFDCYLDADGGSIRLTPQGDALRLDVVGGAGGGSDSQIAVEGGKDFGEFGGPGSDDRVFVLRHVNSRVCEP